MCTGQFLSWGILKEASRPHNTKFEFLQPLHQNSSKTHPFFCFFSVFWFLTIAFSDKELKNRAKHAVRRDFKKKGMIESSSEKVEKVERERKV